MSDDLIAMLRRIQAWRLHEPDSDAHEYCAGCQRSPHNKPPHSPGCIVVDLGVLLQRAEVTADERAALVATEVKAAQDYVRACVEDERALFVEGMPPEDSEAALTAWNVARTVLNLEPVR